MHKTCLNKAMVEALRREAWRDLENSIDERTMFGPDSQRPEIGAEHEKRLLACCDVIGTLGAATRGWKVEECGDPEAETVKVEFSAAAVAWMEEQRDDYRQYVDSLACGNEGDFESNAEAAYLLDVLNRCLAAPLSLVSV